MSKTITLPIAVIVALVVGGAGFYGGMLYGKSRGGSGPANFQNMSQDQRRAFFQGNGQGTRTGNFANRTGNGFVSGTIIAKDIQSIAVKMPDGGSKIVFLSDQTEISRSASGTIADLNVSENVIVTGKANTDGSLTASNIQIRPQGVGGMGGPNRSGDPLSDINNSRNNGI
jgi:hypothetical protein